MTTSSQKTKLIVFSDDWGRHPSSCQHIVRKLLSRYPTLWVNTIGTRRPSLSLHDLGKIIMKLRQWSGGGGRAISGETSGGGTAGGASGGAGASRNGQDGYTRLPDNLTVINPFMWPGFRRIWQRRLNATLLSRAIHKALGPLHAHERRVAITTLPITADLVGRLQVDRWVYYCVDDFSVWPGLDGSVFRQMEQQLIHRVDDVVAVSQTLQTALSSLGRAASLLTHGIDLEHWSLQSHHLTDPESDAKELNTKPLPNWWRPLTRPIILFWGLIDPRLDTRWCQALVEGVGKLNAKREKEPAGSLVLVGPTQSPDPSLVNLPRVVMPGPVDYEDLPMLAAAADVLVMPYADLPVTRAMQPLKFKEYLATGKPVVVRSLPATQPWADAADVVQTAQQFVQIVNQRVTEGVPPSQIQARQRLNQESWERKAQQLESVFQAKKGSTT